MTYIVPAEGETGPILSVPEPVDLHLLAADEAALIAALPQLRRNDGVRELWVYTGPHHALDPTVIIALTPAKPTGDGLAVAGSTLAEGFHVNLRILPGHPERAEILAAAAPFQVTPSTPTRVFA